MAEALKRIEEGGRPSALTIALLCHDSALTCTFEAAAKADPDFPYDIISLSADAGLAPLLEPGIDAVLVDLSLPGDIDALIRRITTLGPDAPVIAFAASLNGHRKYALETLEAGAEEVLGLDKIDADEALWITRLAHQRRQRRDEARPAPCVPAVPQKSLTLIQESPEAMLIIDQDGRVKFANEEAAALLGFTPEALEGKPLHLPLDMASDAPQSLTLPGDDGATRFVEARVFETNEGPVPTKIATLTDVTVRRQLEDTIRLSRHQREEAIRRSRTFFSNVNHDLRTPLTHIIGFSEIMRDERFGPMGNSNYRDYAADIHASGTMLLEMIEDLLGIADAEKGDTTLHEEICNLAQLVNIAVTSQQAACERAGIKVEIDCPENLPGFQGDARRLRQGFFRLLSEIIHSTPPGTVLVIKARREEAGLSIHVSEKDEFEALHPDLLQETSTGARGPDSPERSFLSAQASGHPRQDGLALTLTRRVVEMHGGTLAVTPTKTGRLPQVHLNFPAGRLC
ncbi:PAS/PAC sensor signal transduction histidine kinase [Tepidicaulis marinus]|uniref:histidine kinase n=1 Tax=Tepidicaulis marinus TaxID=1333998 RepID=A0A081BA47_9HYPH|nr:histidine kinase dimerization/phospho-acceptor domain-containing protein [Tepidicaulis marinus]GAK44915.1 PAS/PAC sensor signal transduction histidine kinase [Tepidicaulis marinus]